MDNVQKHNIYINWESPKKTSDRIAGSLTEIRTERFQNTYIEHFCSAHFLRKIILPKRRSHNYNKWIKRKYDLRNGVLWFRT
jgi:hypothetical protein